MVDKIYQAVNRFYEGGEAAAVEAGEVIDESAETAETAIEAEQNATETAEETTSEETTGEKQSTEAEPAEDETAGSQQEEKNS